MPDGGQEQTEVRPRLGAGTVEVDRRAEPIERLRVLSQLEVGDAGVVQGVRIARLAREDRVVDRQRLGEPAGAMQSGGALGKLDGGVGGRMHGLTFAPCAPAVARKGARPVRASP